MATKAREITIEFGRSTSANYQAAVDLAKKAPKYEETGEGKTVRHAATYPVEEITAAQELLRLVGYWKSTSFLVDGEVHPSNRVFQPLSCYIERMRAYRPDEYCFGRGDASDYNDNDLGCLHCGVNIYAWDGLKGFGQMDRSGIFTVDKERLTFEVMRNLVDYELCPALDVESLRKRLDRIPDQINPKQQRSWEYVTDFVGNKSIAVAVKKRPRGQSGGYVVKDYDEPLVIQVPSVATKQTKAAGAGCATIMALSVVLIAILITVL